MSAAKNRRGGAGRGQGRKPAVPLWIDRFRICLACEEKQAAIAKSQAEDTAARDSTVKTLHALRQKQARIRSRFKASPPQQQIEAIEKASRDMDSLGRYHSTPIVRPKTFGKTAYDAAVAKLKAEIQNRAEVIRDVEQEAADISEQPRHQISPRELLTATPQSYDEALRQAGELLRNPPVTVPVSVRDAIIADVAKECGQTSSTVDKCWIEGRKILERLRKDLDGV